MTRALIVGGGLAGSAAAAMLGRGAVVHEREADAHDKICGEFLSVEAGETLAAIGFDVGALGGARIDRIRFHAGDRTVEARLPFVATGVSRRCLDEALLAHAGRQGAAVVRTAIASLEEARLRADGGPLLIATGKHELRGLGRDRAGTIDDMIGFKQYFRAPALAMRLGSAVEVTLFEGGYAGLQRVENGVINLCLLLEKRRFQALGGRWEGVFGSLLGENGLERLADAEPLRAKPLTISGVPYGYLAPPADGLWRLGDQAAVIPSFCGDGMAIALHSGRLAATMLEAGPLAFHRRLRGDIGRQVRLATAVQRLAGTRLGRFALVSGLGAVPALIGTLARWTRVDQPSARLAT
ncbi:NAD(P)/FAD-dependent oxidoreductase [Polymorphobacter sp.]|uniref:NAD(P)/FAD-dependent oxidoreductase n=1 Tax=Polymorphobacter sp. TaxID=1909290 RepID=UPI003F702430